jgi:DNA-binding transcriptional regulator YiaG
MRQSDLLLVTRARADLKSGAAREVRVACGLTQTEIAAQVGVSSVAVSRWEAGNRTPRGAAALRYARLLDALQKAGAA